MRKMKKRKIIYPLLLVVFFLMSCGRGKVSAEKQKNSLMKESEKNEVVLTEKDALAGDKGNLSKPGTLDTLPETSTKKEPSPYLLGRNTKENFIKTYKIDAFEVPIHLTGAFAWSSEKAQREIYKEGYRPPLYIRELYPGIIYYSKWMQHNPESKNVSTEFDKLEYYDEHGNLLKTYDVDAQNPYLKKYPDLVNNFYNAEGNVVDENSDPESKEIHFRSSTNSVFVDENTGFTQIDYMLYNSNKHGNVINFITTFIVLDTLGNEINRLVDKELYINDTYVTPDGKFLALCTGGMVNINNFGDDMNGHRDMGILIYDLADMSLIYENGGRYSDGVSGGWDNSEWIRFRLKNDSEEEIKGDIYFIDPVNKVEYKKTFSYTEWNILRTKTYKEWKGKNLKNEVLKAFSFQKREF